MLTCVEAPTVSVRVQHGFTVTAGAARSAAPGSTFLDGAAQGEPFIDPKRENYNLDHHEGCVRSFLLATCEQAMVLIRKGLDLRKREWTVYANDADLDTVLAIWVLLNHLRLNERSTETRERVMPLVRLQGVIDAQGLDMLDMSALPPELLAETQARIDELREPELALKRRGRWGESDLLGYTADRPDPHPDRRGVPAGVPCAHRRPAPPSNRGHSAQQRGDPAGRAGVGFPSRDRAGCRCAERACGEPGAILRFAGDARRRIPPHQRPARAGAVRLAAARRAGLVRPSALRRLRRARGRRLDSRPCNDPGTRMARALGRSRASSRGRGDLPGLRPWRARDELRDAGVRWSLAPFLSGHPLGRILRALGRHFAAPRDLTHAGHRRRSRFLASGARRSALRSSIGHGPRALREPRRVRPAPLDRRRRRPADAVSRVPRVTPSARLLGAVSAAPDKRP